MSKTNDVARGRRSRVVLTPRRWRQVGERNFTGDGGKKARSPGRARNKRLKPSRAGMPGDPGATVVTNSCATYTLRTRLRVQRAPGIPHALFGRRIHAQLGRNVSRECEGVSCRHCEPTGRANARPMTGSAKQSILSSRPHGLLRRFALRNDDPQSTLCLEITSRACGGGRRARQRNCAPERDGWGKTYLLERRVLWRHPHPNPPPQAQGYRMFRSRSTRKLSSQAARLSLPRKEVFVSG
jgi:hypothetical protein